jgi:hypothetical protein
MSTRAIYALATVAVMGVALGTLTRCEILVNLDRGEVDGAVEDGCPICTNVEGGEDSGEDGGEDAGSVDGGDAGSTDGSGDANPGDGGGEGSTTDSGAGG